MYVGELANLIAAFLFVWPLWFLYQKLGANRKAAVEALLLSIVIRTACACFINANITLPLYAKAMSLPLDEVIRMVASVNPAIKDLNGFIILATIPFNVLKVGLNYIVGQLLFVRLRAANKRNGLTDLAVCCETAEPFHRKDCRETAGKAAWGRIPDNPFCLMERAKTYLFL